MIKLHAKKEIVRKYYKYGTTPNTAIVGNPSITDGIVTGFNSSNYLKLEPKFQPLQGQTWEMVFKVKTPTSLSDNPIIIGQRNGSGFSMYVNVSKSALTINGVEGHSGETIQPSTIYWFKTVYDGTKYTLSTSIDGINYTLQYTYNSSTICTMSSDPLYIGLWYNTYGGSLANTWGNGEIHLPSCHIKVDGNEFWHGTLAEESTIDDYDFYKDVEVWKTPKINNKYYASTQGV